MKTYTLHLPAGAQPGDSGLDRAELVKDGFSWGAFVFTFLWFFVHRLWLAGLVVLVGPSRSCPWPWTLLDGSSGAMAGAVLVLAMILIGLEANSLRRWTYAPARPAGRGRRDGDGPRRSRGQGLRALAAACRAEPSRPLPGPALSRALRLILSRSPRSRPPGGRSRGRSR